MLARNGPPAKLLITEPGGPIREIPTLYTSIKPYLTALGDRVALIGASASVPPQVALIEPDEPHGVTVVRSSTSQTPLADSADAQILTAEGEKQSAILRADGRREAQMLEAEGQAKAIETVFGAIHAGDADPKLLAYQYLQVLPQIAQGDSNKVWIIPSEFARALGQVGTMLERGDSGEGERASSDPSRDRPPGS
jgi:hypothetical protein